MDDSGRTTETLGNAGVQGSEQLWTGSGRTGAWRPVQSCPEIHSSPLGEQLWMDGISGRHSWSLPPRFEVDGAVGETHLLGDLVDEGAAAEVLPFGFGNDLGLRHGARRGQGG